MLNEKSPELSMGPSLSSSINLAYLSLQDGGRVADFWLLSHLTEGFVTENRAQNKLENQ